MKTKSCIIVLTLSFAIAFVSCDRDGNTGNGANDPTEQFESDKVKKSGYLFGLHSKQVSDTIAKETTTLNTIDTTMVEGRHK